MKVDIGISAANLKKVCDNLNAVLADGNVLYLKLRKFHWNLKGPDFMQFHRLFEEQYEAIEKDIDEVAERISTLGGMAIGTTIEFAELSQLKESPGTCPAPLEMAKELLQDHESIVKSLRTCEPTNNAREACKRPVVAICKGKALAETGRIP